MGYTVFMDRDGVINQDSANYIKTEAEFRWIPKSAEAISLLCRNGFDVIVITNQSMIGRKLSPLKQLQAIFNKMKIEAAQKGGYIKDIFFCPHRPEEHCACRKPEPGLIHKAADRYALDLKQTCMVGDNATDIECAINAGCGRNILVLTGNGQQARELLSQKQITPDFTGQDLYDAARWIIRHLG
jgi:D-glycero-D-manno-heptose 1,7-bisphosphate phosphatase